VDHAAFAFVLDSRLPLGFAFERELEEKVRLVSEGLGAPALNAVPVLTSFESQGLSPSTSSMTLPKRPSAKQCMGEFRKRVVYSPHIALMSPQALMGIRPPFLALNDCMSSFQMIVSESMA